MGSIGLSAAARMVWAVAEDPAEPGRHLFVLAKTNVTAQCGGLAFRIVPAEDIAKVQWEIGNAIALSAEDALGNTETPGERSERGQAAAWLADLLGAGPVKVVDIRDDAKGAGFAWRTVERAKAKIHARAGRENPKDPRSAWVWVKKS